MFKIKEELVVDVEGTFGSLKFIGLGQERRPYDEKTGEYGDVNRRTYDLISSKLKRVVEVHVSPELPILEFPFETEVTVTKPDVRGYNVSGRQGLSIKAENIVLLEKGAPKQENQRSPQQPEVKNK